MSYNTINACANDEGFRNRVMACCAQEGANPPDTTMYEVLWPVCCASDVEAAYATALANHVPNPGADESVITDQTILSHVQANWPPEPGVT